LKILNNNFFSQDMSLIDSNLSLVLQAAGEYEYALKFLENALDLNKRYYGMKNQKTALSHHLLARLQSCRGDFRTALQNERETYQIYKTIYGEDHERTRESAQVLKHLTEQAVILQKKMNEMYKGEKVHSNYPPIQIQQPSMSTVLTMLNIINGIHHLPTQEEELSIERFREEILRLQQNGVISINSIKTAKVAATSDPIKTNNDSISQNTVKINAQDDDLQ